MMDDLIDRAAMIERHCEGCTVAVIEECKVDPICGTIMWMRAAPAVDAVKVPCKIGDTVWAIRNFKGRRQAQKGVVSEMYFRKDMTLQIVVGYVARGKWGEVVFATQADAEAALNGERREDNG